MEQSAPQPPRWIARKEEEEGPAGAIAYVKRVEEIVGEGQQQGRLVYRPHGKSNLGVMGVAAVQLAMCDKVKWFIKHAPQEWSTTTDVQNFIGAPGRFQELKIY